MMYTKKDYTSNELKVIGWVAQLRNSQGFYCRLWEVIHEDRKLLKELGEQNFTDILDMVMYLES